jgi:hypothetical protein
MRGAIMHINRRYIVDEHGKPKEVVLRLRDFQKIEELLGLDLEDETVAELRKAKRDRQRKKKEAYVDLDSI